MNSISFLAASSINVLSFSVSDGSVILTPGILTLFLEPIIPSLSGLQIKDSPSFLITLSSISPSSIITREPSGTSFANVFRVTKILPADDFLSGFPVIVILDPFLTGIGESQIVVRISGPLVSRRIAILSETFLTLSIIFCAPSRLR